MIKALSYDCPVAVIGDIHGCSALLARLLAQLPADMPVLVLGDLVDRGPDSRGVLDLLVARGAKGIYGNHELWFTKWIDGLGFDDYALSPVMGGKQTLASYGIDPLQDDPDDHVDLVPEAHKAFIGELATVIDLRVMDKTYWLVHAGVPNGLEPDEYKRRDLMWQLVKQYRNKLLWDTNSPWQAPTLPRPVIMGHLPQKKGAIDLGKVIAVDTGAGFKDGLGLTAVILPERRFVVAPYVNFPE